MQVAMSRPSQILSNIFLKFTSSSHSPSVAIKTRVVPIPPQLTWSTPTPVLNVYNRPPPGLAPSAKPPTKRVSPQQRSKRRPNYLIIVT